MEDTCSGNILQRNLHQIIVDFEHKRMFLRKLLFRIFIQNTAIWMVLLVHSKYHSLHERCSLEKRRAVHQTPSQCQRKSSSESRIFQKDRVQLFCDRFNSFNNLFLSTSAFYVN